MGAGAAKQAKERFPTLPKRLGERILQSSLAGKDYGITLTSALGNQENDFLVLGAFQTKIHWREPSDLGLIRFSCKELCRYATQYRRIAMNYPGVGLGGRTQEQVGPILQQELGHLDHLFIYWKQS